MKGLHEFFKQSKEFRTLYLGSNKISSEGFDILLRNLQSSRIENLDVSGNRITRDGALECLPFFKGTNVKYVNFKNNIIEAIEKHRIISEYRRRDIQIDI